MCFQGSQVDFPNQFVLQSLNIAFIIEKSADPDEMQHCQTTLLGFPVDKEFINKLMVGSTVFHKHNFLFPCLFS